MTDAIYSLSDIQVLQVTESALTQFKQLLDNEQFAGIRLSVVGGGCAGLQYKMDPVTAPTEGDLCQTINEVSFFYSPYGSTLFKRCFN